MKKIEAIVRAAKFEEVKEALAAHNIHFFSFYQIKGYGHQKPEQSSYRGVVYDRGYINRVKLEIVVSDEYAEVALVAICNSAKTGEKGDGIITVTNLDQVLNVRTELIDSEAINV